MFVVPSMKNTFYRCSQNSSTENSVNHTLTTPLKCIEEILIVFKLISLSVYILPVDILKTSINPLRGQWTRLGHVVNPAALVVREPTTSGVWVRGLDYHENICWAVHSIHVDKLKFHGSSFLVASS